MPSQDGGYVLLWQRYDNNKMADMCYYGNVILHQKTYLMPGRRLLFDMVTRLQLVKQIFPRFVEAEVSLPRSQQPAPLVPILSQIISIHTQPSYFFQVFLYTITFSFAYFSYNFYPVIP